MMQADAFVHYASGPDRLLLPVDLYERAGAVVIAFYLRVSTGRALVAPYGRPG